MEDTNDSRRGRRINMSGEVACACSMVVEGAREIEVALEQVSTLAQRNHLMMSEHYKMLY